MGKYHLDLEVRESIPGAYKMSANEISGYSGANLGNLVFRYALSTIVADVHEYKSVSYAQIAKLVAERRSIDGVIVSCANWLGTRDQDERANKVRADVISSIDCPVVSFGLGVQASLSPECIDLGPETLRLARVLAERTAVLSVRDRLTEKVLRDFGINNVVVTGCPSNFINTDPMLGKKVIERATALHGAVERWSDVRACVSEFSGGHAESGRVLKGTMHLLRDSSSFYVIQSPTLLPFLLRENMSLPPEYLRNVQMPESDLIALLRTKTLHFTSVEGWLDFCRTCDMAFGMRIHGNVVPLQAGVPSLLIGHDARTVGLAETMGVPNVTPADFHKTIDKGPRPYLDLIREGMFGFDEKRRALAKRLLEFLHASGLPAADNLNDLACNGSVRKQA